MEQVKRTGLSSHRYYIRWNDMIQRCYNPNDVDYPGFGGRGISVCAEWDRRNPKGAYNFITWLEARVNELPEKDRKAFYVIRRDTKKNYSPEECFLATNLWLAQNRHDTVLSFEKVALLRRYKRDNPKTSVRKMCTMFGVEHVFTLCRCLKGITWANVDSTEPPILDLGGRCKPKA